jgi:3-hydroxybutyryl-CoA dehydrogenase
MGQGIAQVAAQNNIAVALFDAAPDAASAGLTSVLQRLDRLIAKGQAKPSVKELIRVAETYRDFASCDIVVEAVVERLDVKRTVFADLEKVVRSDAILASNTSSLSIGAIAQSCQLRGRIAGMHFFNPVPLMKLVEIVRGATSENATIARLTDFAVRLGRTPIEVKDTPGFLVNLGGRALNTEALAALQEGVASCAEIDAILRDCGGFRMGPFELMDMTGMDVNFPVTETVWGGYFNDPRLRSTPFHANLFRSGRLGRKTDGGYYDYVDGKPIVSEIKETAGRLPQAVVIAEGDAVLSQLCEQAGVRMLTQDDGSAPVLVALWGEDCTEAVRRLGLDSRRVVALDPSGKTDVRITLMAAPGHDASVRASVAALCQVAGRKVTVVKDSPGFVTQRICAMVMNLGCEIAQLGLADPQSIDKAFQLGLGYPLGPLAMADSWGLEKVHGIMLTLQRITGDDRYRPSQWLRRRAVLGMSALTPA